MTYLWVHRIILMFHQIWYWMNSFSEFFNLVIVFFSSKISVCWLLSLCCWYSHFVYSLFYWGNWASYWLLFCIYLFFFGQVIHCLMVSFVNLLLLFFLWLVHNSLLFFLCCYFVSGPTHLRKHFSFPVMGWLEKDSHQLAQLWILGASKAFSVDESSLNSCV